MNLGRILQLALTSLIGQGVTIIGQLLVPPFFLRFYPNGIQAYGEWMALNASIAYLGSLNYGVQTYASNQLTILYNRGDVEDARSFQASTFSLLLILIVSFAVLGLLVFALPVGNLLRLQYISSAMASATLYVLILQLAAVIAFSFLTNSYMAVGLLHRGNYWAGAQRLFSILATSAALFCRASFPVLAIVQLACLLVFSTIVLRDLRQTAPILLPSLQLSNRRQMLSILKPSGHFGLIAIGGFLTWQGPLILIQRLLGSTDVAIFSIVRVVFQMSRQLLIIASSMVSQDIAQLVGQRSWSKLRRLYVLSEKVVLFLIPVVSIGSLLMCPVLFALWLHKRDIFDPTLCILMAVTSAVLGIKEHKTQFQTSSNTHESLSWLIVVGYATMLAIAIPATKFFGLPGFMVAWITWEMLQTAWVLRFNDKLFPDEISISAAPVLRLLAFMTLAFGLSAWPAYREAGWSLSLVTGVAAAITALLAAAAYYTFGLEEVFALTAVRIRARFGRDGEASS